ncbi:MAG: hypothetical protein M0D55_08960 [Elusimicrobiota bacterium]|nr:MAG: hypothetical protein M0D55_08960 [Elusimicrobiota bacterium]
MSNSAAARVLLAATLALFATSARADSRAQKYYYEDIASPFFAPDPARPGWMKAQRPGSKDGSFRKEKPPGVFRVFVLGGSIAGLLQYEGAPATSGRSCARRCRGARSRCSTAAWPATRATGRRSSSRRSSSTSRTCWSS